MRQLDLASYSDVFTFREIPLRVSEGMDALERMLADQDEEEEIYALDDNRQDAEEQPADQA